MTISPDTKVAIITITRRKGYCAPHSPEPTAVDIDHTGPIMLHILHPCMSVLISNEPALCSEMFSGGYGTNNGDMCLNDNV